MRTLHATALCALLALACDSGGTGDGATETNVSRVPCTTDDQCGGDLRCIPIDGDAVDGGATGLCEVRDGAAP